MSVQFYPRAHNYLIGYLRRSFLRQLLAAQSSEGQGLSADMESRLTINGQPRTGPHIHTSSPPVSDF